MHAWIKFTDQSNYVHERVTVHRQTHTTRNNFSKISRRLLLFGNKLSQKILEYLSHTLKLPHRDVCSH